MRDYETPIYEILFRSDMTREQAHCLEKDYTMAYNIMGYNVLNDNFGDSIGESVKIKLSDSKLGDKNPMFGKTHSEEVRK